MSTAVDVLIDRLHGLMPRHALVLGSGLGSLVETVADPVRIPYADLPGLSRKRGVRPCR
jgi:purine-nucleoside phosphorylase